MYVQRPYFYIYLLAWRQSWFEQISCVTSCVRKGQRVACPCPRSSDSDLFEKSDDILAYVRQPDNDIVVVDVAEGGVVPALPPGLLQNQIPAVHGGHQILVFSETAQKRHKLGGIFRGRNAL